MSKESSTFQKNIKDLGDFRFKIMNSASWQNALEVFSNLLWVDMILWAELLSLTVFGYVLFYWGIIGKLLCISYVTYWYVDCRSAENGQRGQGSKRMRSATWLRHFYNYFPLKLVKTVDLPPTKNYLFAVYPHGVIGIGSFGNFATSHSNFHELFPGIRSKLCTLNYHFWVPFYRDLLLSWGLISANRKSLFSVLTQSNNNLAVCNYDGYTSNAAVLVVGGAQEAFYARPGDYRIVLNKRKGFVKIAIQTGAAIVPCFNFGEIDAIDQMNNEPGTRLRAYQEFIKKWTGVAPIIPFGRGLSEKSFGMLPYRRPITAVVGAPLEFTMNESPSKEEIDALHARFTEALNKLFSDHKHKYLKNADNVKLIIE